jgi:hypothetical protein
MAIPMISPSSATCQAAATKNISTAQARNTARSMVNIGRRPSRSVT